MAYKRLSDYGEGTRINYNGKKAIVSSKLNDGLFLGILDPNATMSTSYLSYNIPMNYVMNNNLKSYTYRSTYSYTSSQSIATGCDEEREYNRDYDSWSIYCLGSVGNYVYYDYTSIGEKDFSSSKPTKPIKNSSYFRSIDGYPTGYTSYNLGTRRRTTVTEVTRCSSNSYNGPVKQPKDWCVSDSQRTDINDYYVSSYTLNYNKQKGFVVHFKVNGSNIYVDDSTKNIIDYAIPIVKNAKIDKEFFVREKTILTWTGEIRSQPYNDTIGSYEVYQSINGGDYVLIGQPRDARIEVTPQAGTETIQFKIRARSNRGYWGQFFITNKYTVTDVVLNEVVFKTAEGWKTGLLEAKDSDNVTWHNKPVVYVKKGNKWVTRKIE